MTPVAIVAAGVFLFARPAAAEIEIPSDPAAQSLLYAQLTAVRDTLKNDLVQMQIEQRRCNNAKRNWTTATVIGGVGVIGTTIGVIAQNSKLRNQKQEMADSESQLRQKQLELQELRQ